MALNANQSVKLCSAANKQAAVALIIDGSESERDPKVIFIQRALNRNDPWSGQMALPGGRCEREDSGPFETARTEINWDSVDRVFPGICVGDGKRVIWGLTYRFLSQFFSLLGHSLPP